MAAVDTAPLMARLRRTKQPHLCHDDGCYHTNEHLCHTWCGPSAGEILATLERQAAEIARLRTALGQITAALGPQTIRSFGTGDLQCRQAIGFAVNHARAAHVTPDREA